MKTNEHLRVDSGFEIGEMKMNAMEELYYSRYISKTLKDVLHRNEMEITLKVKHHDGMLL